MAAKTNADRRPRPALDRRKIAIAALALIDERGIEHLSMRSIGAALNVEAMALYYHFSNKAALLDGVRDLLLDEAEAAIDPCLPPLARIRASFQALRAIGMRHPDIVLTLGSYRYRTPRMQASRDALLATAGEAGLAPQDAALFLARVAKFTLGACMYSLAIHGNGLDAPAGAQADQDGLLAALAPLPAPAHLDHDFEQGLDLLFGALGAASRPDGAPAR